VGRYALFKRFPLPARHESDPIVDPQVRARYSELDADFRQLDDVVAEPFEENDLQALRSQNAYRAEQVLVILGSALVSVLGAAEAAFAGQRWWGVAVAVAGVLVAGGSQYSKERDSLNKFLGARMRAERLRGEYFWFLARIRPYDGDDRVPALRRAVARIRRGQEPR
jgi:hypothetical protein